jgi:hypothetical protein
MSSVSISMWTTFVIHPLDLHDGLIGWGRQHAVIAAAVGMLEVHGATQRFTPEASGLIHVRSLAVD